ncbi:hypothetical protein B0H63DRAFT_527656 [Podospora didyma]|uniref:Uncharacterized protein n=1 Tax=Podospora didyma TaxID=330526 RepID=A0AAE0K5U5_9PEZI|nr:hypothetical protein B0H63DRAFT_527656 [Podospora didyma]
MPGDSPWLAAATGLDRSQTPVVPVVDLSQLEATESTSRPRDISDFRAMITRIDPSTSILHIAQDAPTDQEWDELGRRFTNLRRLHVSTGFDENWTDEHFPLSWPLQLLIISDAAGELVSTPAVVEGRVEHLVLFLTCGLRFEGPKTRDMMKKAVPVGIWNRETKTWRDAEEASRMAFWNKLIADAESQNMFAQGDGPGNEIKVFSVPAELEKWMVEKYGKPFELTDQDKPDTRMSALTILENDAIETFLRLTLAHFHVVARLENLTLRSTRHRMESMRGLLAQTFPVLANLKTLHLTLGDILFDMGDPNESLRNLPPNLEALHFRGPVSLAPLIDTWIEAFAEPSVLPSLKRLSFVLDLGPYDNTTVEVEKLRVGKDACRRFLGVATARGVTVEEFHDPWAKGVIPMFKDVDTRWAELDKEPS